MERILMKGNEALAEAAIQADVDFILAILSPLKPRSVNIYLAVFRSGRSFSASGK